MGSRKSWLTLRRVFELRGTVIRHVWWQIIVVEVYAAALAYVHFHVIPIHFSQIIIDILGVVTGLLLAFRTQTAYERFSEGRDLWAQMTVHIRNLTRDIWTHGSHDAKRIVEKKSAINLLLAFAVATKHYIREEHGYRHDDLKDLISFITTAHMNKHDIALARQGAPNDVRTLRDIVSPNIPIELSYYVASYFNHIHHHKHADDATLNAMRKALSKLVGCLTSFERIQRTPIPLAYSVHLTHLTWLYTLSIPLQTVHDFGWASLLIVGFAAFAFLGILDIGQEIENPFAYEPNDLPLDAFCDELRLEMEQVLAAAPLHAAHWLFSSKNTPFLPKSSQSADHLATRSVDELTGILGRAPQISTHRPRPAG